ELLTTRTEVELAARTLLEDVEPTPEQNLPAVACMDRAVVNRPVPGDAEGDADSRGTVQNIFEHKQVLFLELPRSSLVTRVTTISSAGSIAAASSPIRSTRLRPWCGSRMYGST